MAATTTQQSDLPPIEGWTRRRFLQTSGAATTAVAAGSALAVSVGRLASAQAPKTPMPRAGARIRLLQWNSFVRVADTELKRQATEWGAAHGVTVEIET